MRTTNEAMLRRWFEEIWNQGNIDVADRLLDPEGVLHDAAVSGKQTISLLEFKAQARALRAAVPNIRFDVDVVVDNGAYGAARITVRGTHTGEGLGIPPTGRAFCVSGIVMGRFRDGRIVEGWNCFDMLGLWEQLGMLSRPSLG